MQEGGGSSTFLQKCKDLLDLNNKKKWLRRMIEKMKNPCVESDYRYVCGVTTYSVHHIEWCELHYVVYKTVCSVVRSVLHFLYTLLIM